MLNHKISLYKVENFVMFVVFSLSFVGIVVFVVDYFSPLDLVQSFIISVSMLAISYIVDRYVLKHKREINIPFIVSVDNFRRRDHNKLPLIIFIAIFSLDLSLALIGTFTAKDIVYSVDRALFAINILSQIEGLPANNIGADGIQTGLHFALFPSVYSISAIMALSNSSPIVSIYLIIFVNALIHAVGAVIAFLLISKFSTNWVASIVGTLAFAIGIDYYWVAQLLTPTYPYLVWSPLLYLGTPFPSDVIGTVGNPIPSVGLLSFGKSFINQVPFTISFVAIAFLIELMRTIKTETLGVIRPIIFMMLVITAISSHLVTGSIIAIVLTIFLISEVLVQRLLSHIYMRRVLVLLVPLAAVSLSVVLYSFGSIQFNNNVHPGWFLLSLLYYTGPLLLMLPLVILRRNIIHDPLVRLFLILSLFPLLLLYRFDLISSAGEWFTSQIAFVLHTGIVLLTIPVVLSDFLSTFKKGSIKRLAFCLVSIVVVSGLLVPLYQYYASQVSSIHPYWRDSNAFIHLPYGQMNSIKWIDENTERSDVVFIAPNIWSYLPALGRPTIITTMGVPPEHPRIQQANQLLALDNITSFMTLADQYDISHIYLNASDDKNNRFSAKARNFPDYIRPVYNDQYAKIFQILRTDEYKKNIYQEN